MVYSGLLTLKKEEAITMQKKEEVKQDRIEVIKNLPVVFNVFDLYSYPEDNSYIEVNLSNAGSIYINISIKGVLLYDLTEEEQRIIMNKIANAWLEDQNKTINEDKNIIQEDQRVTQSITTNHSIKDVLLLQRTTDELIQLKKAGLI